MNLISKELFGNDFLLNLFLKNYGNKKLNNSIIISGIKGLGKNTFVFYFITKIFEELSHKKINNHKNLIYNKTHPNIKYIHKNFDEKTNKYKKFISIDQIRNLENFIFQSSFDNNPKFIIIDSADDLNNFSANGILKILEEPKDNTFFILITHQLSNLLPTIRSRCVKYIFEKPNFNQFCKIIESINPNIEADKYNFLYNISNSSPGIACDIFSENLDDLFYIILDILKKNQPLSTYVLNLVEIVSKFNDAQFKNFLLILRFILITISKINLGYDFQDSFSKNLLNSLKNSALIINNESILLILEYLNKNENDLFIFNLDKKIFSLNIFSTLNGNL